MTHRTNLKGQTMIYKTLHRAKRTPLNFIGELRWYRRVCSMWFHIEHGRKSSIKTLSSVFTFPSVVIFVVYVEKNMLSFPWKSFQDHYIVNKIGPRTHNIISLQIDMY